MLSRRARDAVTIGPARAAAKWVRDRVRTGGRTSYAQCGEDIIVHRLLVDILGISKPSYLDVGAHHPTRLSNTYFFYRRGASGVCIEPNPQLCAALARRRRRDICLNIGIGRETRDSSLFYIMHPPGLSTFQEDEALYLSQLPGHRLVQTIMIPMLSINEVIQAYFSKCPDFLSLDTEGSDADILQALDVWKHRPPVVCVETVNYCRSLESEKDMRCLTMLLANDYLVYADTHINTILVDSKLWAAVPGPGAAHSSTR